MGVIKVFNYRIWWVVDAILGYLRLFCSDLIFFLNKIGTSVLGAWELSRSPGCLRALRWMGLGASKSEEIF